MLHQRLHAWAQTLAQSDYPNACHHPLLICAAVAGRWAVVHLAHQRLRPLCWGLCPHNRQPAGGPSPAVRPAVPRRDPHGEVTAAAQKYYIALPSGRHMQPISSMPVLLSSVDRGTRCLTQEKVGKSHVVCQHAHLLPGQPVPRCVLHESACAAPALWHVLHSQTV